MNSFDCNSVLENLSEYLDAEAREELCMEIAEHLSRCRDCSFYVDTVKKTIVLYQAPDRNPVIEVPVRATAKLEAALARAYEKGTERAD